MAAAAYVKVVTVDVEMPKNLCVNPVTTSAKLKIIISSATTVMP